MIRKAKRQNENLKDANYKPSVSENIGESTTMKMEVKDDSSQVLWFEMLCSGEC